MAAGAEIQPLGTDGRFISNPALPAILILQEKLQIPPARINLIQLAVGGKELGRFELAAVGPLDNPSDLPEARRICRLRAHNPGPRCPVIVHEPEAEQCPVAR